MTDVVEDAPASPRAPHDLPTPRRPRRRPAPPANPFFRFVFPVLVVIAGFVVLLLWRDGTKAVLDTTDGEDVLVVTDPDEPGFLAFTTPTPTLVIAHTDDGDALVGVSVLAQTALDQGASLTLLSRDLLLDNTEDVFLNQAYAAGGAEGLEAAVAEWMDIGFTDEPMVMSTERLTSFFELVEPIPFVLVDDLVLADDTGGAEVVIEAGARDFSGRELAQVYGWLNPGEPDATRFGRQLDVWRAWLGEIGKVGRTGDEAALIGVTLPFDDGLPPYLRAMATGTADLTLAPMAPFWIDPDEPLYALDVAGWPRERALATVPLPIAHAPGAKPTVQVLDGTGDPANRDAALPQIVAAGGEVTIIGNAWQFGVEETTVSYHLAENAVVAEAFADALGVAAVFEENPDEVVDLTVTIGANP